MFNLVTRQRSPDLFISSPQELQKELWTRSTRYRVQNLCSALPCYIWASKTPLKALNYKETNKNVSQRTSHSRKCDSESLKHYWKMLGCYNNDSGTRNCVVQNGMDVQSRVWEMSHMVPVSVTENFAVNAPSIFESALLNV